MSADLPETSARSPRPLNRRVMHVVRRLHMYLGLFLFPWALLYGVSGFLFNHPTAFSEQKTATFGQSDLEGTPLADVPSPTVQAQAVVTKLNERLKPETAYKLGGEATYTRDFAFALVKVDGQTINILFDVKTGGGTVRLAPPQSAKTEPVKAPFAVGKSLPPKGNVAPLIVTSEGILLANPLHERVKATVPVVMERTGFPTGEVTVTSVPDIAFPIEADGQVWTATYSPMTGSVSGKLADNEEKPSTGWRQFVLRLHTAHGYPGEANVRWYWAFIVDVMSLVLVFWAGSGLFMWWQIKASRRLGLVLLVLSAVTSTAMGIAMYAIIGG
jgi:hypothetical protein